MEYLLDLLGSADMLVAHHVLGLLYTFARRSNYFTRLPEALRSDLHAQLRVLAEVRFCKPS